LSSPEFSMLGQLILRAQLYFSNHQKSRSLPIGETKKKVPPKVFWNSIQSK
jgi:hypothetical protein